MSIQYIKGDFLRPSFHNPMRELPTSTLLVDFKEKVNRIGDAIWSFRGRAISQLNARDHGLDQILPDFLLQKKIDTLIAEIEKKFAPLVKFNNWLSSNGHGKWAHQLAEFLAKLPFRAARNIIQQLYIVIKGLVYGVVHPLKALNNVAKFLVLLPYELVKPETWSAIGVGVIGASCGEAVISGGFLSLVGLGIGAAMCISGVSLGTLQAALKAEEDKRLEAAFQYLCQQGQKLSETLLTSFYTGLIIGGIRKAIRNHRAKAQKEEVEQLKKNHTKSLEKEDLKINRSPDFYEVVELCRTWPEGYPPIAYAVKLHRPDVVKFFLDTIESPNIRTPHTEHWVDVGDWNPFMINLGNTDGLTALELAIQQQDVEMVKLLTTYNSINSADPLLIRNITTPDYSHYAPVGVRTTTTPLSQALALGNKEIAEALIKACKVPEKLFATYAQIQATQHADIMRLWIEKYAFLCKGEPVAISEETIKILLNGSLQEAISSQNTLVVKQLFESGWIVSRTDIEKIFFTNNQEMIELLMKHSHLQNGVRLMEIAIDLGAIDVLKTYVQQGIAFDGLLLHAVLQKQKAAVEVLLNLPISIDEIEKAHTLAYQRHCYDIMELLGSPA